jgi:hypothetical protein
MTRVRIIHLAFSFFLLAGLGCGGGNSLAPARVSGSITYKGQPLKSAAVALHTPQGNAYPASVSPDGTYSATDLPTGELVITVDTEGFNPSKKGAKGAGADRRLKMAQQPAPEGRGSSAPPEEFYVKIPAKYSNPKTSPLTVTLAAGRKVYNIELTD